MNATYRNAIADHGASLITHIGLVDELGNELTGGAYARQPVTWTTASDGTIRPTADIVFNVPAGVTVGGWRGYSALTAGTDYDGQSVTQESFNNAGEFTLVATGTGILHNAQA